MRGRNVSRPAVRFASFAEKSRLHTDRRSSKYLYRSSTTGGVRIESSNIWLLGACGLTLLSAFVCGLAPALIASKVNLVEALNAGGKIGGDQGGKRLRGALAVAQIAITLALLIGAGLVSRSLFIL